MALFWTGIVFIVMYVALGIYCIWHIFVHKEPVIDPHVHYDDYHHVNVAPSSPPPSCEIPNAPIGLGLPVDYPHQYPSFSYPPPPPVNIQPQFSAALAPAPRPPPPVFESAALQTSMTNPPQVQRSEQRPEQRSEQRLDQVTYPPPVTVTSQPPRLIPVESP